MSIMSVHRAYLVYFMIFLRRKSVDD